jgi:hypothetical protein
MRQYYFLTTANDQRQLNELLVGNHRQLSRHDVTKAWPFLYIQLQVYSMAAANAEKTVGKKVRSYSTSQWLLPLPTPKH